MAQRSTVIEACPSFIVAMEIVSRRWNGLIIQALAKGCHSFTAIAHFAEGINDTSLSRRLKDLESEGLVTREVINDRPVKVRYGLTEAGAALAPVLDALTDWGERYVAPVPRMELADDGGAVRATGAIHAGNIANSHANNRAYRQSHHHSYEEEQ